MQILKEETKNNIQLVWLTVLEGVYSFAVWQRMLVVGCIVLLLPAYWLVRVGTTYAYGLYYARHEVESRPAFQDPQPLVASPATVLPARTGGYVAYAKVSNPNLAVSATQFVFSVSFYSADKKQVYQTSGQSYVAAGKDAYVTVPLFSTTEVPSTGTVTIGATRWQKKFFVPEVVVTTSDPARFAEADGVRLEGFLTNTSAYKLGAARVVFLVEDASGRVIAVADRTEFSLLPRERRAYVISLPGQQLGSIARVVPFVYTNVTDISNIQVSQFSTPEADFVTANR